VIPGKSFANVEKLLSPFGGTIQNKVHGHLAGGPQKPQGVGYVQRQAPMLIGDSLDLKMPDQGVFKEKVQLVFNAIDHINEDRDSHRDEGEAGARCQHSVPDCRNVFPFSDPTHSP
jgi:hypothetical protein